MKAYMDEVVASYADTMERRVGYISYDLKIRDEDDNDLKRPI